MDQILYPEASSEQFTQPLVGEDVPTSWAAGQYVHRSRAPPKASAPSLASNQMAFFPSMAQVADSANMSHNTMDFCYTGTNAPPWGAHDTSSSSYNSVNSWYNDQSSSSFTDSYGSMQPSKANMPGSPQLHRRDRMEAQLPESNSFVANQPYGQEQSVSPISPRAASFGGQAQTSPPSMLGAPLPDVESSRHASVYSTRKPRSTQRRNDNERPPKRRRPPSETPSNWLSFSLCSLWQRNHMGSPTLNDINLMCTSFSITKAEIYQTWQTLYGDAMNISGEATPRHFKARYIDAFCSMWRLAFLDLSAPSDEQIDSLSQLVGATKVEIRDWFNERVRTNESQTPANIEASAITKFKENQKECLQLQESQGGSATFQIPFRDATKPFVCTTGCGENFSDNKKWKRHEEKNYWQSLWVCTLKDCSKRRTNKHVFSRPDMLTTHIGSCHEEIKDTKDVVRRAKKTGFSNFPKYCIFRDCDAEFTSWKCRTDHLEHEFRTRSWSPSDWRDYIDDSTSAMEDDLPSSDDRDSDDDRHDEKDEHDNDRDDNSYSDSEDDDSDDNDDNDRGTSAIPKGSMRFNIRPIHDETEICDQSEDDDTASQSSNNSSNSDKKSTTTSLSSLSSLALGKISPTRVQPAMAPTQAVSCSASTIDCEYGQSSTHLDIPIEAVTVPFRQQEAKPPIADSQLSMGSLSEYGDLRSDRHIRLLQLTPSTSWKMYAVSLDSVPAYTALSYTWGADTSMHTVTCNNKAVEVPANCYDALHHLQLADSFRHEQLVWVDAICINHNDNVERKRQVELMEEIYRKAARALIWLGKGKKKSKKAATHTKPGSISLVTFDDMMQPMGAPVTQPEVLNDGGSLKTLKVGDSASTCSTSSRPKDSCSVSNLSGSSTSQLQSFQFQMGYQCFDDTALQLQGWLKPDSTLLLGANASSTVERVSFDKSQYVFARKTLRLSAGSELFFPQEAVSMRRLQHPHIVHLILGYVSGDTLTILMEPSADTNLQQYMASLSPTKHPRDSDWNWFSCLTSGLLYMHDRGLRHRDIKPSNILIKDGTVFYADFGLSNDIEVDSSEDWFLGNFTRQYAAPEFFTKGHRSKASDIWSLGCVFMELLTVLSGQSITRLYATSVASDQPMLDPSYYKNQEALQRWMQTLKVTFELVGLPEPLADKRSVILATTLACERMIDPVPLSRPTARQLLAQLGYNSCCTETDAISNTHNAATAFLRQLHWRLLMHLNDSDHQNDRQNSDFATSQCIFSRLFADTCEDFGLGQNDVWKQVRFLTSQISPGATGSRKHVSVDETSLTWSPDRDILRSPWIPLHSLSVTTRRDIRTHTKWLQEALKPLDGQQAVPEVGSAKLQRFPTSPFAILQLSLSDCSQTEKLNERVLISAAWIVFTGLDWTIDKTFRIFIHLNCPFAIYDSIYDSEKDVCNEGCSIRFDRTLRNIRKDLDDSRESSRRSSAIGILNEAQSRNPPPVSGVSRVVDRIVNSERAVKVTDKLRRLKYRARQRYAHKKDTVQGFASFVGNTGRDVWDRRVRGWTEKDAKRRGLPTLKYEKRDEVHDGALG